MALKAPTLVSPPSKTASTARPSQSISRLASVSRCRLAEPLKLIVYGDGGTGKSTLAASMPAPIWLDANDGSGRLNVTRYPFRDGPGGHVPRTYNEITNAIDDL